MSTFEGRLPYHHGDLPDALITTAIALLHEGGVEAVSLRALARRAGVSPTAPYRHFADKEALLAAVAAEGFRLLKARLMAADAGCTDAKSALIAQGAAYVTFACDEPPLFRLMFGTAWAAAHPALSGAGDDAYAVLASRVATLPGVAMDDPDARETMALAAWSLVHGLACLLVDGDVRRRPKAACPDPAALARRVTALLLDPRLD